jgi:hypothetical protein
VKKYLGVMNATVLVFSSCILNVGVFNASVEAAEQIIEVECPAQKNVDITLSPAVDSVGFNVKGSCWCAEDAGKLKTLVLTAGLGSKSFLDPRLSPGYEIRASPIKPGETREVKLYCYTPSMLGITPPQ